MCVRFSVAKIFVFCVKLCLLLSILLSFFLLNKTFCSFFCSQNAQLFSGTYLYQVCQTYDKPLHLDFQLKHQYQPKLISLILLRHLQKPILEFHLVLHCSVDHTAPKHYGLILILSIVFPIAHIYALTFHFCLADFWWQSPWGWWFIFEGVNSVNSIVLHALHLVLVIHDWLLLLSSCIITMDHILMKITTNQPYPNHS